MLNSGDDEDEARRPHTVPQWLGIRHWPRGVLHEGIHMPHL